MFPLPKETLKVREGALAETPFALLLHAVFVEERTVVLEIRRNQLEKKLAFEDGVPVGCKSNLLHETLGRFLVDRGRITEQQCHDALGQSVRDGEPLGEILVKRQLLAPYDLYKAMQQNVARRILDCFTWTDAKFRWHGAPEPEDTPFKMNPAQLILTASTTVLPFDVVAQGLMFFDGQRFAKVAAPPHAPEDLKLHAKDVRLLQILQKRPTFEEICAQANLTSEEAMRRLYAFGVLGIVNFSERVAEVAAPAPVAAPIQIAPGISLSPAPAAAPPQRVEETLPPQPSENTTARANEVMEAFLKHRQQDPFDLFGVKTSATLPELKRAYVAFSEKYRPAQYTGELAAIADKAEELFLAGARAYGVLADYESRNLAIERRARRLEEQKRKKGEAGADFKIQTGLLDAGQQFREGLAKLQAGQWAAATRFFEFACDIDHLRADYRSHLGWARFRDAPMQAEKPLADLAEALKLDPRCDSAHFFRGQISEETGDLDGAEENYRRAIKAKPDERRYTEALKAVSLKKAKKR